MAEEYKNAAEAAGHQVTLVNVSRKKIAGCLACEYCHNKGNGACIQKDDMQELYPLMAEAEVLVLAAPIYYFTLNAQIQASHPAYVLRQCSCQGEEDGSAYVLLFALCLLWRNSWVPRHLQLLARRRQWYRDYKIDEQKTDETKAKIQAIVNNL